MFKSQAACTFQVMCKRTELKQAMYWKVQCLGHGEEADQGYGEITLGIGLECR